MALLHQPLTEIQVTQNCTGGCMSTRTPAPNEHPAGRTDEGSTPRNDPAIDPLGSAPATEGGPSPELEDKAEENRYSPDFAPDPGTDRSPADEDADIDTDGG
jgi:hypothetical protein